MLTPDLDEVRRMRAVVQRVSQAVVTVDGSVIGQIGRGLLVLIGAEHRDTQADVIWLAGKVRGLRVFEDQQGKMNLGLEDVGGELLVVSQLTLLGNCRKGRRPSFVNAAASEQAESLYNSFVAELRAGTLNVATGRFQAQMDVTLTNEGPVTLLIDSRGTF